MITRARATTTIERARLAIGSRRRALAALSVALTLAVSPACAHTRVTINRDGAVVYVEAGNAPLSEVLSALEGVVSIRYRTAVPLDQPIVGTYRGSPRYVLSRLLDGFSYYVADTADGRMEITVIGRRLAGDRPSASPRVVNAFPKLEVPPPTVAEVLAERERAHHRRPPVRR
jgi:hypothetical protein